LPTIGFMRPFGCHVTILNTLDPLGKFQGKVDEGFLVGYSVCNSLVDGKEHDDDIQKSVSPDIYSSSSGAQTRKQGDKTENKDKGKNPVVTIIGFVDLNAEFEECNNNSSNGVSAASSLVSAAGNKARLVAQGHTQEEGIDYEEDAKVAESEGRNAPDDAEKQAEIYNLDLDHSSKVLSMQEDDLEVQDVVEVVTTAKLITKVVITAASQVSATSTTIPTFSATIPAAASTVVAAYTRKRKGVIIRDPEEELSLKTSTETPAKTPKVKDKGKGILIEAPKPMKKKNQIELDAEYARKLHEELDKDDADFNKDVDWDAATEHVNQKSSINPQYIKRYQGMKKRPQTDSEARKNIMLYLKNTDGYKMDFFKGMSYADICPIFQARFDENMRFLFKSREEMEEEDEEIIKSINKTPAQKAAKRRKLNEEAQEAKALKKQLEIVHDEDDDVFTEATLIGRKVPVVNYEIVMINNKPWYKIIRADDTHQLYTSFITLLKNFDREDLEDLWRIVKDRFSTSKPTNFFDDYLLSTLKTMFEKTDRQDAIWRNQQSVYGKALVKS
nr:retrovirus-related Pol polyprotein from transposon TNT 1-94 [Tanacetum cinerariifolium]